MRFISPYAVQKKQVVLILFFCMCLLCPAHAGTEYLYGSPNLSVTVSGTNEFSPGDDISIPVVVINTGTSRVMLTSVATVSRDDLPDTAKNLIVALSSGDAPLVVKSDPLMAGDLAAGSTVTGTFTVKVNKDAPAGTYRLPVSLNYSYLEFAEQYGTNAIRYSYQSNTLTIPLAVTIRPAVTIDVLEAVPEALNVGTEGYVNIRLKNTGSENAKDAVIRIERSGSSPVIPVDSSVYIGDFPAGSEASCRYKVSVSSDAGQSTYPVDIVVEYQDREGDTVTSPVETAGVAVGEKIEFDVISPAVTIHPGQKNVITVEYKNTGTAPVYSATGRISIVEPFTSSQDIVYLGDIGPGESAVASYQVSVDRAATIKGYGLDSEIRYQDAQNTTYISNTMKVGIDVTRQGGVAAVLSNPILMSVIFAIVVMVLYGVFAYRKRMT